jgi:hypothetical protein
MGTLALLKLKHKDIGALFVFCLLGFLAACMIPDPTWAVYTSILVADHLFLGWLLFMGDDQARRQIPVAAILAIHLAFVLLVIGLVASRHHIPYFNLLPYPLAGVGVWILSSAAGVDPQQDHTTEPHHHRDTVRAARRAELQRSLQVRVAARELQHPSPAGQPRPKPARKASYPAAASRSRQPTAKAAASQPVPQQVPQAAATPSSNLGVFAQAQREVDFAQLIAAMSAFEQAVIAEQAQPQSLLASDSPASQAASPQAASLLGNAPQTMAAVAAPPPIPATAQPLPGAAAQPVPAAPGIAAELRPLVETPQEAPVFLRDNSIAESIRQKPPEELARLYPILSATSEDHEEWLKERGSRNPTHRKLGLTVREEYEHWLMARAAARNAPDPMVNAGGPPAP